MADRRTAPQIYDSIGRPVKPGDIIAMATNGAYGNSAALRLILLEYIYLDDSKGKPYYTSPIYFRDVRTGLLYESPTDETRPGWQVGSIPVHVDDPSIFTPVKTKRPLIGWDYTGSNEVVAPQDCRLVGQPVDRTGEPLGKIATYEPSNFILVEGVTPATLKATAGSTSCQGISPARTDA